MEANMQTKRTLLSLLAIWLLLIQLFYPLSPYAAQAMETGTICAAANWNNGDNQKTGPHAYKLHCLFCLLHKSSSHSAPEGLALPMLELGALDRGYAYPILARHISHLHYRLPLSQAPPFLS
jgi:hypothetical protein